MVKIIHKIGSWWSLSSTAEVPHNFFLFFSLLNHCFICHCFVLTFLLIIFTIKVELAIVRRFHGTYSRPLQFNLAVMRLSCALIFSVGFSRKKNLIEQFQVFGTSFIHSTCLRLRLILLLLSSTHMSWGRGNTFMFFELVLHMRQVVQWYFNQCLRLIMFSGGNA